MKILAIDTATEACSASLLCEGETFSQFHVCPREHSQRLLPMIQELLEQARITVSDLDAIAYGHGPGSFTGVRIASGMMQGLALGANLPVIGVSTLEAMAQGAYRVHGATQVVSTIDARMDEVYFAIYQRDDKHWSLQCEQQVIPPEQAHQIIKPQQEYVGVGTGFETYKELLTREREVSISESILYPDAQDILAIAVERFNAGDFTDVEQAQPLYLRDKVTWKKLPGRE